MVKSISIARTVERFVTTRIEFMDMYFKIRFRGRLYEAGIQHASVDGVGDNQTIGRRILQYPNAVHVGTTGLVAITTVTTTGNVVLRSSSKHRFVLKPPAKNNQGSILCLQPITFGILTSFCKKRLSLAFADVYKLTHERSFTCAGIATNEHDTAHSEKKNKFSKKMSRLSKCTHPVLKQRYIDLMNTCENALGKGFKKQRVSRKRTGQIAHNGKTFLKEFAKEVPSAAAVLRPENYAVFQAMLRMLSDLKHPSVMWHKKDEAWSPSTFVERDAFRKFIFASPFFYGVFV